MTSTFQAFSRPATETSVSYSTIVAWRCQKLSGANARRASAITPAAANFLPRVSVPPRKRNRASAIAAATAPEREVSTIAAICAASVAANTTRIQRRRAVTAPYSANGSTAMRHIASRFGSAGPRQCVRIRR